jgi:hypothetical protein
LGKDKRKRRKEKNREGIPIPIAKPEKKTEHHEKSQRALIAKKVRNSSKGC